MKMIMQLVMKLGDISHLLVGEKTITNLAEIIYNYCEA